MVKDVNILHISDLHFRPDDDDRFHRKEVTKSLVTYVRETRRCAEDGQIDLILVTGDVAYAGKPDEYTLATNFFNDLRHAADVDLKNLLIVPGNHDVYCTPRFRRYKHLFSEKDADNLCDGEIEHFEKFSNFCNWHDEYYQNSRRFPRDNTFHSIISTGNESLSVAILPVNSALFCLDNGASEKGTLRLLRPFLWQAKETLEKCDAAVKLVMIHHPLDWLHPDEQREVREVLQQHANVLLSGHIHQGDAFTQNGLICLSAGATLVEREETKVAAYIRLTSKCPNVELQWKPIQFSRGRQTGEGRWQVAISFLDREDINRGFKLLVIVQSPATKRTGEEHFELTDEEHFVFERDRFYGRDEDLLNLRNLIGTTGGALVIHGQPRIGKSYLALELARQLDAEHRETKSPGPWRVIPVIDCNRLQSISDLLSALAKFVLRDRFERDLDGLKARIKAVCNSDRLVVVLDNLHSTLALEVSEWLSQIKGSIILITCSRPLHLLKNYLVHGLELEGARTLFIGNLESTDQMVARELSADIDAICERLSRSPVLIENIARLLRVTPAAQMLRTFDALTEKSNRYLDLISLVYERSLGDLETSRRDLLNRMSTLPAALTPQSVEALSGSWWNPICTDLMATSLVERTPDGQAYMVPQSVKDLVIARLYKDRASTELTVATKLADLAHAKAPRIDPDIAKNVGQLKATLDWFDAEWANLRACWTNADVALRQSSSIDSAAHERIIIQMADAVLHVMIPRGHLADCKDLFLMAITIHERRADTEGRSRAHNNLGVCFQFLGNHKEAVKHLTKSLAFRRDLKIADDCISARFQSDLAYAKTLNSTGVNHIYNSEHDQAEKMFDQARKLCDTWLTRLSDEECNKQLEKEPERIFEKELSQCESNLSFCYRDRTEKVKYGDEDALRFLELAETSAKKALYLKGVLSDSSRMGQTLNRLALVYVSQAEISMKKADVDRALYYLKKAIQQFEGSIQSINAHMDDFELGKAYQGLGRARELNFFHSGDLNEAEKAVIMFEKSAEYLLQYPTECAEDFLRAGELCCRLIENDYKKEEYRRKAKNYYERVTTSALTMMPREVRIIFEPRAAALLDATI